MNNLRGRQEMLFDLFMKFVLTPENVLGLVFQILTIVSMCLIFHAWKEKWWKSLIPFYGTYLLYQHTWKRWKWLFLVEMIQRIKNKMRELKELVNNEEKMAQQG